MNTQKVIRRPAVLLIALLVVLALATTAFAAGGYVVYHIANGDIELPENSIMNEWIDFEPDAVLPYENYTEENGEVTVTFGSENWNQAE